MTDTASTEASNNQESASKKRILIVDDETTFTRMVRMNLEQTGRFDVKEENRATHALQTAKEFQPDLILLDVIMPSMDGGELASRIKADPKLAKTPIVFLTATVSKHEAQDSGFTSGGFLFLAKPVSLQNLLKTIDESLAGE
ncbi:MAG: response regulator [Verrucomicrobiae bacterium]|jgi:CheY-like chemotaxis protein|nr:response regulator [Verrucomicrobiae bacterium]